MKSNAVRRVLLQVVPVLDKTALMTKPNHELMCLSKNCNAFIHGTTNKDNVKHSNTSKLSLQDILNRHQAKQNPESIHFGDLGHVKSSRTKLYYRIKHYINDEIDAKDFVKNLKEGERQLLLSALEDHNGVENGIDEKYPTSQQLKLVFIHNCIPFVGFGFLDNAIMISAGEYIDMTIGITFGITTMAAAAIGNLISDLAGIGLAGYVEALCLKMGLPVAQLTPEQADMKGPRVSSYSGKAFGIIVGCIIGMFPLLFMKEKPCDTCVTHECDSENEINNNNTTPKAPS